MAERFSGIPSDEDFADQMWLPAPEIEKIADRLIEHKQELVHIFDHGFQIAYFWKREGGKQGGQAHIGQCRRLSGDLKAFAPGSDYMIWLAADHCRDMGMTMHQAEGFVFHELLHTGADDKGKAVIRPHDWQGFSAEVAHYGVYYDILQAAGAAFQQLRLEA